MRQINEIIVHCTATFPDQNVTVADITRWHKQRGFQTIGYHFVISLDGLVHPGRPVEEIGAHCKGHNANSIGVCYVGGLNDEAQPCDTRNEAQKAALIELLTQLKQQYPGAVIHGHKDFSNKACPCFDATNEYASL